MAPRLSRRGALGLAAAATGATLARPVVAASPVAQPIAQSRAERPLAIISPALTQEEARAAMPAGAFAFVHGGAGDECILNRSIERLRALQFRPRRLAGFSQADTGSTLLGRALPAPIYVCPMGAQDMVHVDAEPASARGAVKAGVAYILSSASNCSLEEVARAAPDALRLFALYLNTDPSVNRFLAHRAREAGYAAIVMTVDSLGPGDSERYRAMGSPKSPVAGAGDLDPHRGGRGDFTKLKRDFSPADIGLLKEASGLPVLVKGVLRADDAERCIAAGAAGIVVSNHGGRTLDGAPAAIDALGPVVDAVRGRVPVLFDSGVRRGEDVARAGAGRGGRGRRQAGARRHGVEWWERRGRHARLVQGGPGDRDAAGRRSAGLEPVARLSLELRRIAQ